MQIVRFTYNTMDIELSVFLLLYLRMNGIFVCERFFDLGTSTQNRLLSMFSDAGELKRPNISNQFDMELFAISNEQDFFEFQKYRYTDKMLVIISGSWKEKYEAEFNEGSTIDYDKTEKNSRQFLNTLVDLMWENDLIEQKTRTVLSATANIYCCNQIMKLSFEAKYFYITENENQYKEIADRYQKIYRDLIEELRKIERSWGNEASINLQYAVLNMAYEGSLYSRRNRKRFIYSPKSIINVCNVLLEKKDTYMLFGDSIYLLMAQVYDDLLQDTKAAYSHYMMICKDYNSYAYYRKAVLLINSEGSYESAIKYLTRSVFIYPNYYRAWHMLGISYNQLNRWKEAVQAFENMEVILLKKIEGNMVRPMEIEYLFKAACQCGDIYNQKLYDVHRALKEYKLAEKIWHTIDSSLFLKIIGFSEDEEDFFKKRMKNELSINRVYTKLSELYRQSGDIDKAMEYLMKLWE